MHFNDVPHPKLLSICVFASDHACNRHPRSSCIRVVICQIKHRIRSFHPSIFNSSPLLLNCCKISAWACSFCISKLERIFIRCPTIPFGNGNPFVCNSSCNSVSDIVAVGIAARILLVQSQQLQFIKSNASELVFIGDLRV